MKYLCVILKRIFGRCRVVLRLPVFFGHPADPEIAAILLFPFSPCRMHCGLAGIIAFHSARKTALSPVDLSPLKTGAEAISAGTLTACLPKKRSLEACYLGGGETLTALLEAVDSLKRTRRFTELISREDARRELSGIAGSIERVIPGECESLAQCMGHFDAPLVEIVSRRIEALKDIHWRLRRELLDNLENVMDLAGDGLPRFSESALAVYRHINTVLNGIDRMEVRGRDSAGFSLLLVHAEEDVQRIERALREHGLLESCLNRNAHPILVNDTIRSRRSVDPSGRRVAATAFTWKTASEIGRLGDNVAFLRSRIQKDRILQQFLMVPHLHASIASHTRWASVGEITEPNCHPMDGAATPDSSPETGLIFVCLNGDIDNHRELKARMESAGVAVPAEITTDTKIIPLRIARHLNSGTGIEEAFRLAVNEFEGSHAIAMHSDLAPGKLFLAQKGSGQAIFVGLAPDLYMPASEVYGFVEETSAYVKMDGERVVKGDCGDTQGQIFILDSSASGIEGIRAMFYDGTPVPLGPDDIRHTEVTSRDIDRQGFPHYFLKEISESPVSVEKTLLNRWKFDRRNPNLRTIHLDDSVVPARIRDAIRNRVIRNLFFLGQGTAGIAANVCANIAEHYLDDPGLRIRSFKSSEFSGFNIDENNPTRSMSDTLIVAISQSGTTTDTNRTVDMARERGAHALAIVNRRDSDLTFKVDGVLYTSSGRDIEMSVASTKAFYSQIVAGAILSLCLADILGRRDPEFIDAEIGRLLALPSRMGDVINHLSDPIRSSAFRHAGSRTYWAAVGSGPNKAAADEIRIKLSELCYKTISSDVIEDKKHIDLSSEPLIIVCAAGARQRIIGDLVKDTAIFKAHKAIPIVIADEGEHRFDPYGADVFHAPRIGEHLAPVLNTLVGHLWGYHAAMTINEASAFLHAFRLDLRNTIDTFRSRGMDIYEAILEKEFREKIASFYAELRRREAQQQFPSIPSVELASNLTLLLKYLAGRLPVSDFEIDFGMKGTPVNMLDRLFACLGESINSLARPIDAIKHQAKTVTVGTSRIVETLEGVLFDEIERHGFVLSRLINQNVLVLKHLQKIVSEIKGATVYRIGGLNLLGEPTEESTIEVMRKEGSLATAPSRVERDNTLKGTKKIIVRQGNVHIGRGRSDSRSILVIPLISANPALTNRIEHLLLFHIGFNREASLRDRIKALGGKYEHIVNIVQENSIPWQDDFLDGIEVSDLFGDSAEKVAERIVALKRDLPI